MNLSEYNVTLIKVNVQGTIKIFKVPDGVVNIEKWLEKRIEKYQEKGVLKCL